AQLGDALAGVLAMPCIGLRKVPRPQAAVTRATTGLHDMPSQRYAVALGNRI
ncbi:hypothetical protein PSYJA_42244, partial [Pseudomonas syringae pv. japonica str. M301072]